MILACEATVNVPPANELYEKAVSDQKDESYSLAVEQYRMFLDHYPLDPRSKDAELRLADSYFADEAWPEAIVAYANFQRMHPTHHDIDRVEFRIAAAYEAQIDTLDRDLGAAQNAHQRYHSLVLRHAGSPAAQEAQEALAKVREHLAARELYVASFYLDRGKQEAGEARVAATLLRYPETKAARDAIRRLEEFARAEGNTELAELAAAAVKDHPRSQPEAGLDTPLGPATVELRNRLVAQRTTPAAPVTP